MPPDREQLETRTDQELVDAGNRGDAGALAALYLRHREWAAAVALRFAGDRDEAMDVVQEAFAYLLGKFPGFVLRAKLTTVLYPAIKNTALAGKRKKRPDLAGEGALELYPAGLEAGGADEAGRRALAAAVGGLPGGQREVLIMRVVDEMAVAEIALALGIPEGTVKSRLHHALAALREDPGARAHFGAE